MSSKSFLIVLGVALLASTAGLVRHLNKRARTTTDFPDGLHWVCVSCNHGFSTSREEFAAWAEENDKRWPCSQCGEHTTAVAQRCPLSDCGAYYAENNVVLDGAVCCPVCRRPLP